VANRALIAKAYIRAKMLVFMIVPFPEVRGSGQGDRLRWLVVDGTNFNQPRQAAQQAYDEARKTGREMHRARMKLPEQPRWVRRHGHQRPTLIPRATLCNASSEAHETERRLVAAKCRACPRELSAWLRYPVR
jgi:hypothetical protein